MKKLITVLAFLFSSSAMASSLNCQSWPISMSEVWLKNSGIVDIINIDESKTVFKLLAAEKKGKGVYTQIYHLSLYDKSGNVYELITSSNSTIEECSISDVTIFLVSRTNLKD